MNPYKIKPAREKLFGESATRTFHSVTAQRATPPRGLTQAAGSGGRFSSERLNFSPFHVPHAPRFRPKPRRPISSPIPVWISALRKTASGFRNAGTSYEVRLEVDSTARDRAILAGRSGGFSSVVRFGNAPAASARRSAIEDSSKGSRTSSALGQLLPTTPRTARPYAANRSRRG